VLGSTEPRLWTPPLRELTPETSFGFDVIDFADDVLDHPLDDWQRWLIIHGGELLPDGRPRFRQVLVLVARQNGKTELLVVLTLFWLFVDAVPLVLGTSTKTNYARETLFKIRDLAESCRALDPLRDAKWVFTGAGAEEAFTREGSRYKISAATAKTGRSLTIHRLVLDELRLHHTYGTWDSAVYAMNAVRDGQVWALSNAGDDRSVVLNDKREAALHHLEKGDGDERLGLFEWSAPEDADPLDVHALAQANPNMGRRIDVDTLLSAGRQAVTLGGEALTGFKTESMCIRVKLLNPAIDASAWRQCLDVGDLNQLRSRVAVCLDVAPDNMHATLVAAAVQPDDRVRVEVVKHWEGYGCTDTLRRQLPGLITKVKPRAFGWLPNGPAASLAADLGNRKGRVGWPPPGVTVSEIRRDTAAACMGLHEQVVAGRIAHADDPLLNAHVTGAERLKQGDAWVFSRRGEGHCDAAYAVAGAVHLARTLPNPVGKPRLVVAS